jgi:hypothetical protein
MKTLIFLPLFCLAARAQVAVFTIAGTTGNVPSNYLDTFTLGDTFTAQLTVDLSTLDTNPGPDIGSYQSTGASLIQFSNGLTLSNVPFEYVVANDRTASGLDLPFDGIAFYFVNLPTLFMGFEMRYSPDTFANVEADAPTQVTLIPHGNAETAPDNWFYDSQNFSGGFVSGTIDSLSMQVIPEPSTYAAILGVAVLVKVTIRRRRPSQRGRGGMALS